MPTYLNTVTVPRPLATTFDYVSDFGHSGSWDPRVLKVTRTSGEGPVGVGTSFDLDSQAPFSTMVLPYKCIEYEASRLVVYTGQTKLFKYTDRITFTAIDDSSTSLTYDAKMDLRGLFAIGNPIFAFMFQRVGDDAVSRIAQAVVKNT